MSSSCPNSPSTWSLPPGLPGPNDFEYLLSKMRARSKQRATVTREAKTAKMVTMAAEMLLEDPPEVPSG